MDQGSVFSAFKKHSFKNNVKNVQKHHRSLHGFLVDFSLKLASNIMLKNLPKSIKKSFEKSAYVLMDFSSILGGIWAPKCRPNRIRKILICLAGGPKRNSFSVSVMECLLFSFVKFRFCYFLLVVWI